MRFYLFRNHIFSYAILIPHRNTPNQLFQSIIKIEKFLLLLFWNYGESVFYLSPPHVCLIQDLISIILVLNYFETWVLYF